MLTYETLSKAIGDNLVYELNEDLEQASGVSWHRWPAGRKAQQRCSG